MYADASAKATDDFTGKPVAPLFPQYLIERATSTCPTEPDYERITTMIKMSRKRHPSPPPFDDDFVTESVRHLGEWFTGIYSELSLEEQVAWLELLVLAKRSGGQINYISTEQISALLSLEKGVLEAVLKKGQEKGKIEVVEKAIIPARASQLRALPEILEQGGTVRGFEVRLTWTKPCAVYKSMLFPGAFSYFREEPISLRHLSLKKAPHVSGDLQGLRAMAAAARDLMKDRLENGSFIVPSRQLFRASPFRICEPQELPASIMLFDEALGPLEDQILDELDSATCTWHIDPQEEFEQSGGGILCTRWSVLDRLDRFAESRPSCIPWRLYPEEILGDEAGPNTGGFCIEGTKAEEETLTAVSK